jgi:4'-phosphopantetheinyl transferase
MSHVLLWCWPIDQAGTADWDVLDPAERSRAARFVHDRHRASFVRAHAGLRALLGRLLGVRPGDLAFAAGTHGKPWLVAPGAPCFSLSHSGDVAALAVSSRDEVGLDIECVRAVEEMELAERFFSDEERRMLAAVPVQDRRTAFFNAWTRKEAYLKAIGLGLTVPLDGFSVSLAAGDPPRLLSVAAKPDEAASWQLVSFEPAPGYVGAIAARATGWEVRHGDPGDALL